MARTLDRSSRCDEVPPPSAGAPVISAVVGLARGFGLTRLMVGWVSRGAQLRVLNISVEQREALQETWVNGDAEAVNHAIGMFQTIDRDVFGYGIDAWDIDAWDMESIDSIGIQ